MIKTWQISKIINKKKILDTVSLQTDDRGIYSIVGPNGAGKTSLLKSIMGFNKCSGEIEINGEKLVDISLARRRELITYCSELNNDVDLKVSEIFNYAREVEDLELMDEYIARFHLYNLVDSHFSSLSGGERQRVALACAFYQDTKILLLDEPTNFLDPLYIDHLIRVITELKDRKLIIIVSHNLNFVMEISKKIFALQNGSLIYDCSVHEIIENKYLDIIFNRKFNIINAESGVFLK